jgi:hypothetical protein
VCESGTQYVFRGLFFGVFDKISGPFGDKKGFGQLLGVCAFTCKPELWGKLELGEGIEHRKPGYQKCNASQNRLHSTSPICSNNSAVHKVATVAATKYQGSPARNRGKCSSKVLMRMR